MHALLFKLPFSYKLISFLHLTLPKTLWSKGWHPLGAIQSGNAIFFSCKNMVPPKKVVGLEEKSLIAASFTYNVHLYSATAHLILIYKKGRSSLLQTHL